VRPTIQVLLGTNEQLYDSTKIAILTRYGVETIIPKTALDVPLRVQAVVLKIACANNVNHTVRTADFIRVQEHTRAKLAA
jgi:hypothetical protein